MRRFEEHTLRDAYMRAAFFKKLAEIRSIQHSHTFLAYATHQHLFDELVALYEENLEKYQQCYVKNREAFHQAVARAGYFQNKMHPARFSDLLRLRQTIESLLEKESYAENRKASPLIQAFSAQVEAYVLEMAQWKELLLQRENTLAELRGKVWWEDYRQLLQQQQRLKHAVFSDYLPEHLPDLSEESVSAAVARREEALHDLALSLKSMPVWKQILRELEGQALPLSVFEQLKALALQAKQLRTWIIAGLGAIGLMLLLLLASEAPGWIIRYRMRNDWDATQRIHTYQAYQAFIEKYREGSYVVAARDMLTQLVQGEIAGYVVAGYGSCRYVGALQQGVPHGPGKAEFVKGSRYEGDWQQGVFHGTGTLTTATGESYTGEWVLGKMSGEGTYFYADSTRYSGTWEAGEPKGKGTRTLPDSSVFSGTWVAGKLEGPGTWRDPDGSKYQGNWKAGNFHGQGTYTYPDGSTYKGEWQEGVREGQGVYTWATGRSYTGDWQDNAMHGSGIMRWENGAIFSGTWKEGLIQGAGSFTSRLRESYAGRFVQDSTGVVVLYDSLQQVVRKGMFQEGLFVAR